MLINCICCWNSKLSKQAINMLVAFLFCTFAIYVEGNEYANQRPDFSKTVLERLNSVEALLHDQKQENTELRTLISELQSKFDSLHAENQKLANKKHEHAKIKSTITELQSQVSSLRAENQQCKDMKQDNMELKTVIHELESQVTAQNARNQELTDRVELLEERKAPREDFQEPVSELTDKDEPADKAQKRALRLIPNISVGDQMNRLRRQERSLNVAFYALLSTSIPHLGVNQNVVFDRVITNIGNSYNSHAGDFRAPVSGTYVFSVTLTAEGYDTARFSIAKAGTNLGIFYLRGAESPYTSSSMTAVLELSQGEDVYVRNIDADKNVQGSYYSSFSGFLLTQAAAFPVG